MPENRVTYNDLYTLFLRELDKKRNFPWTDTGNKQTNKTQVRSTAAFSVLGAYTDTTALLDSVFKLIDSISPQRIRSGLIVSETDPYSNKVTITAGEGSVGSTVYNLSKNVDIEIPFDNFTYIFYVNLYQDGIKIERNYDYRKVALAKVIVPQPGVTAFVRNTKDNNEPFNAYIINLREFKLYGDGAGHLEEESKDLIREAISPLVADDLTGIIKISESLKLINTAETLDIGSSYVTLKDSSGNIIFKFNKNGIFFYNNNIDLLRFDSNGGRIGNIKITKNSLQSENYLSGLAGFKISDSGECEFSQLNLFPLPDKSIPVNTDIFLLNDSEASNATKKVLWSEIKSVLKTYFDTIYSPL